MNEKDLLQKLKDNAEYITPPASLHPDAVEQMLRSSRQADAASPAKPQKKHKTLPWRIAQYGSIAAVFALALTALWHSELITQNSEGGDDLSIQTESEAAPEITDNFTYASDYEDIYNKLYEQFSRDNVETYGVIYDKGRGVEAEAIAEDFAVSSTSDTLSGTTDTEDYSTTNVQEAGVDEGDIVKTDGKYIYILRQDSSLAIIEAGKKEVRTVSITELPHTGTSYIHEMYLDGTVLNVITSEYITSLDSTEDIYYTNSRGQTRLFTYDISDPENPVLSGTVTQDGAYEDSRKNGQYLYLFTSWYPDIQSTYGESAIIPRINGAEAAADTFYLPDSLRDSAYLVISSIDTAVPDEVLDSKVLVSGVSNFYVSTENIYIANEQYHSSSAMTEITKFHYENGKIAGVAAGSVKGYLNNSFSMNEYNGKLRVVSTYYGDEFNALRDLAGNITGEYYEQNWEEHNALYVLDESLQQIGAIEGLAEGETIRSARFFGDTGYFVTFRQTDPLFSVDLSNPENPVILGELKVSGFSSYLHFYGENLLLGIGYEADEESGITSGLKLSMFDVSDPTNVTEVNRFVLPGITWCPAIEDYKSILVDPEKNLIGFYCDNRYMVFSYDAKDGFTRELIYDFYSDLLTDQAEYNTMRGLYIEDTFYLAGSSFLLSFDMEKGFDKTDLLTIE